MLFLLCLDTGFTNLGKECKTRCVADPIEPQYFYCLTIDNDTSTGDSWDYCTPTGKNDFGLNLSKTVCGIYP